MSRMHFLYTHENAMGYGRMGTQLHKCFTNMGIDVLDGPVYEDIREKGTEPAFMGLWAALPNNILGWFEGQYRAVLTMWEATHLPENLRDGLHNIDMILVPSEVNLECYQQYHNNVHLVPLGVDPVTWDYRPRQMPRVTFRFLADGRGPRKGTDLSRQAFSKAFKGRKTDGPKPTLILKGNRAAHYADPDTELVTQRLSDLAEVELFAGAHCFMAPTRGEGWGLQPLQAIAQGCPTILTDAHGQAAFSHLGWPISATMSPADYFIFGNAGDWWEPNVDEMVDHMRWIYDNYEKAVLLAKHNSEVARTTLTWQQSAEAIIKLLPDLDTPFTLGKWKEPSYKKYPIIMRVPWDCEVAGRKFHFEADTLYWERGEIKRILYEGGYLDPKCFELDGEDNGLLPEQNERIEQMSAEHAWCPMCGQQFNSKPLYDVPLGGESGL